MFTTIPKNSADHKRSFYIKANSEIWAKNKQLSQDCWSDPAAFGESRKLKKQVL